MTKGRARAGTRTIQYMYRYSTTGTVLDLASTTVPTCQPRPPRACRALLYDVVEPFEHVEDEVAGKEMPPSRGANFHRTFLHARRPSARPLACLAPHQQGSRLGQPYLMGLVGAHHARKCTLQCTALAYMYMMTLHVTRCLP